MELFVKITFSGPVIAEDVVADRVADALHHAVVMGGGIAPDDEEAMTREIQVMVKDNRDTTTVRTIFGESWNRKS